MASFAPIRGTKAQIDATPKVDGQFLIQTDQGKQNKIFLDLNSSDRVLVGGGGHDMNPTPSANLVEDDVVNAVVGKYNDGENDEVASIFSIGHWTNLKRKRLVYNGTVGHTGIGTWVDGDINDPSTQEADWWENDIFTLLDNSDPLIDGYDVDFKIMVDPQGGEPITLGGYLIDTAYYNEVTPVGTENPQAEGWYEESGGVYTLTTDTTVDAGKTYYSKTGKICIRFANYVMNPATAKIAVDITFTRTDVAS